MGASPTASATVHAIHGWRRVVLWPLTTVMQLWGRTLRFDLPEADRRWLEKIDEPVAFVLWHNRLFLTAEIFRRHRSGRPLHALISASKDGAWLDAFFSLVGMRSVRGSSSKLGREALFALVDVLKQGNDIGITPDGPRGPRYVVKAGSVLVTRRTHTTMLVLGGEFEAAWTLRSWDAFKIPHPFSTVRLRCSGLAPETLATLERDDAAALLQTRLQQVNRDTDGHRRQYPVI